MYSMNILSIVYVTNSIYNLTTSFPPQRQKFDLGRHLPLRNIPIGTCKSDVKNMNDGMSGFPWDKKSLK